jgi:hypothetical protein
MREEANRALRSGDIERALDLWRGISGGEVGPGVLLEHVSVLFALLRFREAGPLIERLRNHPEADAAQLLGVAKLLFEVGRHGEAARITARVYGEDPGRSDVAAMHAAALERSGGKDEAREVTARTLEKEPGHLRSVRMMAHLERLDGDFEAARRRLEGHLAGQRSAEDWRLRYELAAVLDRMGEYEGAMRALAAAKVQLQSRAEVYRQPWRQLSELQWGITSALDGKRLSGWAGEGDGLTPDVRLCLMGGFPRSGTTLLENVLAAHPDCVGTDETGILPQHFRNPWLLECETAAAAVSWLDGYEGGEMSSARGEYLRGTEEYLGEEIGGRVLLEKDPLLTCDLAMPLRLFPEAKILMPLRDPRDVVVSYFFTIVPLSVNSFAAIDLGETCRYYAEVMRHWLRLKERLDRGRWHESRYEDLLAEPEATTRGLADFLGLDWTPELMRHERKSAGRTVSTPTYDDVSKPLYTRSRGRWRNYERWLEPHLHHLLPYLKAFGYE